MKEIMESQKNQALAINELCRIVHEANGKWWQDLETGKPIDRNVGEMLMLCVSELAEAADGQRDDLFLSLLLMKVVKRLAFAMEGHRKSKQDDKLPHRPMLEVELVDAIIRIFDIGEGLGLDLGGAFVEKMSYNLQREDHKVENRLKEGGKKY